jgi:hypothetical protein
MGFKQKRWLSSVAIRAPPGLGGCEFDPQLLRGSKYFATHAKSAQWDPRVRSDRRVGLACQVGPMRGTRGSGRTDAWDPRVRSDQVSSVGPSCQVGPMRGTRVSVWTDVWDPRVRSHWRVGSTYQVRPTSGTRVSGWTYRWDPRVRMDLQVGSHISKIDTTHKPNWHVDTTHNKIDMWILHISKIHMWQFNYFKYILN